MTPETQAALDTLREALPKVQRYANNEAVISIAQMPGEQPITDAKYFVGCSPEEAGRAERAYEALDVLARELERLEGDRDEWHRIADDNLDRVRAADLKADAERARADRLAEALVAFFAEWDGDVGAYAPTDDTEALMRAALAEHGSPESGEDYDYKDDSANGRWGEHGSPEEDRP